MWNQMCVFCKVVCVVAVIGLLNWGLVGVANFNFFDYLLGAGSVAVRVVDVIFGLAGVAIFVSFFRECPNCKKVE